MPNTIRSSRRSLATAGLLALAISTAAVMASCQAQQKRPAAARPASTVALAQSPAPGADEVVATFAGQKVTAGELDRKVARKLYELRKDALEGLINERLLDAAAARRKMTREQFIRAEVLERTPPPSDDEVKEFYERLKADGRIPPGAPLEALKPQLVASLSKAKQEDRAREVIEKLRRDAGVRVTLVEPRIQVAADGAKRGPATAPVTIVAFSDFQCPYCARAAATLDEVVRRYGDKVRIVFRNYPLPSHAEAPKAAEAALCADEQGKFWGYHDKLFANQRDLGVPKLKEYATQVAGLDAKKLAECLDSGKKAAIVARDLKAGEEAGVSGTPAFFINGRLLTGAQPVEEFQRIIDEELRSGAGAAVPSGKKG